MDAVHLNPVGLDRRPNAVQKGVRETDPDPRNADPHPLGKPRLVQNGLVHPFSPFPNLDANRLLGVHRQGHKPRRIVDVVLGDRPSRQVPVEHPVAQKALPIVLLKQRRGIAPRPCPCRVGRQSSRFHIRNNFSRKSRRLRHLDLLLVNIPQQDQVVPLKLRQRQRVPIDMDISCLKAGLGHLPMVQRHPVRHVLRKALDRRHGRQNVLGPRRRPFQKGVLDGQNAKADVFHLVGVRLVEIMKVLNVIGHKRPNHVLFFRQFLAIVVVAPNHDGGGQGREAPQQIDGEVEARRPDHVFVVKDVPRDDDDSRPLLDLRKGLEKAKEVVERGPVVVFSRGLGRAGPYVDIADMKEGGNGHA